MRKILVCICTALLLSGMAFAQESVIPQRLELTSIDVNDGERTLEVFNMPQDDQNHYFLSVGHLGIGDDVIQIQFDPIFELFIPLGDTLDEAMETLNLLKNTSKDSPGTTIELEGCLAAGFPNDKLEPVKITARRFLFSRLLEFAIEREDYIRSTHIARSDISSIVTSMNLYRKIHPNEE